MVAQESINPVIPGFAPDPSVVHVNGWFFLVTSSFHLFPGLPVYASQDLSSWKHIGQHRHQPRLMSLCPTDILLLFPNTRQRH